MSASIAGYGPAVWTMNGTPTSPTISGCFTYTATTTFQLPGGDSTLVLDENAAACAPGNSSSAPSHACSVPLYSKNSTWSVDPASSGVFFGMSGGGTDALETAGARPWAPTPGSSGKFAKEHERSKRDAVSR